MLISGEFATTETSYLLFSREDEGRASEHQIRGDIIEFEGSFIVFREFSQSRSRTVENTSN